MLEKNAETIPVINESHHIIGILNKNLILKAIAEGFSPQNAVKTILSGNISDNSLAQPETGDEPSNNSSRHWTAHFLKLYSELLNELETIINSTHNLIISIDQEGKIKLFNHAAEQALNKTRQEVTGKHIKEVLPNSQLTEIIELGEKQILRKVEINNRTFISNRTPIKKDGKIVGAVAVLQDISELEAISQELKSLKELNQELDAIINSSFDGLYITDGEGLTLRLNPAFERITGVKAEEFLGKNVKEIVEKEIVSQSVTLEVLKTKAPVTIIQQTKAGKTVLTTGNPIFNEKGEIFRVVSNARDITELNELKRQLEQAEEMKRYYENQVKSLEAQKNFSNSIVAVSPKMKAILNMVRMLGEVDSTILITGETGVGKELIAEEIYKNSRRKNGPYIKVNCGAIPENLLESELFGYEKGAFTGANKEGKIGLFQLADGGTIFLDEVGELPLNLQVKLLRVLQTKEIIKVGGKKAIPLNVRIIAATNRSLEQMIKEKTFREDLYYRLNVIPIHIPPLRERREDIPCLIMHFLERFNQKYNKNKYITPEVIHILQEYPWPGNVRELENFIERLLVMTPKNQITRFDLPYCEENNLDTPRINISGILPLKTAVEIVEKQLIEKAYAKYKTTRKMAQVLEIDASTISRKAAKYNIPLNNKNR